MPATAWKPLRVRAPRRWARAAGLLLCAALGPACQDLPPIGLGACGNGVVEADRGEDCDRTAGATDLRCGTVDDGVGACRFLWDGTHRCPSGYGRGADGLCRQAAGLFEPAPGSPTEASLGWHRLADLDADGRPDLLTLDAVRDGVGVRWGDGSGRFTEGFEVSAGATVAPPAASTLLGDAADDVVLPLARGLIVLRGDAGRDIQPAAYSTIPAVDRSADSYLFPLQWNRNRSVPVVLSSRHTGNGLAASAVEVTPGGISTGFLVPLSNRGRIAELAGRPAVVNLDPPSDGGHLSQEAAIGLAGSSEVLVLELVADPAHAATNPVTVGVRDRVTLPAPLAGVGVSPGDAPYAPQDFADSVAPPRLFYADADADGRPDLLAAVTAADGTLAIVVAPTLANGHAGPPRVDAELTAALREGGTRSCPGVDEQVSVGVADALPRALADFDGDGRLDPIVPTGLIVDAGRGPEAGRCAFLPGGYITSAVVGDFNRDGHLDAAVTATSPGLTVAFGDGEGGFNPVDVTAVDGVDRLRAGDFDGDFVDDLAYVVVQDSASTGADDVSSARLDVIFGRTDARLDLTSARREMAMFEAVQSMEPYRDDRLRSDVVDDLMVIAIGSDGEPESRAVASLIGTAQRLMLSPLVFDRTAGLDHQLDGPMRLLAGRFDGSNALLAIAKPMQSPGGPGGGPGGPPAGGEGVPIPTGATGGTDGTGGNLPEVFAYLMPSNHGAALIPADTAIDEVARSGCTGAFTWETSLVAVVPDPAAQASGRDVAIALDNATSTDPAEFARLAASPNPADDGVPGLLLMRRADAGWRCATGALADDFAAPQAFTVADVDSDDRPDLIVAFDALQAVSTDATAATGATGATGDALAGRVAIYWGAPEADGLPFDLKSPTQLDLAALPALAEGADEAVLPVDVAAAQLDADPAPELLVALSGLGVVAFDVAGDRKVTALDRWLLTEADFDGRLAVGDVNRDGLDDVTVRTPTRLHVLLGVDPRATTDASRGAVVEGAP